MSYFHSWWQAPRGDTVQAICVGRARQASEWHAVLKGWTDVGYKSTLRIWDLQPVARALVKGPLTAWRLCTSQMAMYLITNPNLSTQCGFSGQRRWIDKIELAEKTRQASKNAMDTNRGSRTKCKWIQWLAFHGKMGVSKRKFIPVLSLRTKGISACMTSTQIKY